MWSFQNGRVFMDLSRRTTFSYSIFEIFSNLRIVENLKKLPTHEYPIPNQNMNCVLIFHECRAISIRACCEEM